MTLWQEAKNWLLGSFRRYNGLELPDAGRSSVEDNLAQALGRALSQFGGLQPEVSFEYLALLKQLMVWNPLMAQFVANVVNLGNTGHQIVVEARTAAIAEAALKRINESAARLWPHGAGVDGLINQYFIDIAWSGALSSEDEVNFRAARVEKVVLVPVEQIRFTWDGQNYLPHQLPKNALANTNIGGMIPLNAETYRYFALTTVGNSPYAKPPATAAIEDLIGPYCDGKANLKNVLKKYGLLGFASMQVTAPTTRPGRETDDEYHARAKSYLGKIIAAVKDNWQNGLLVMFRDQKLDFHNVTGTAQGVKDIFEIIEGGIFNGFGMQPSLFGRVHSTTETFADVVWSQLDAQVSNIRRLPKRRMERTYNLDLTLAGIQVNGVTMKFNRTPSRNALAEAQSEQVKVAIALEKARAGIISADQAAQELGYDSAFDPDLLSDQSGVAAQLRALKSRAGASFVATFRFDRNAQQYRFEPSVIELAAVPVGAASQKKKDQLTEEEIDRLLNDWIAEYLAAVTPIAETALKVALETIGSWLAGIKLSDFNSAQEFADKFFEQLQTVFTGEWESGQSARTIKKATEQIYRFYRTKDDASVLEGIDSPVKVRFGDKDLRALEFFEKTDRFYFSKFLNNNDAALKKFIGEEYIAKGGRTFGGLSAEQIADIRAALGDRLEKLSDVSIDRIVRSAVARNRNWGHVYRLRENKVELFKIIAVLDSHTSEICKFLDGKFVRVTPAAETIDRLNQLEPGEFAKEMYESPEAKRFRAINNNPDEVEKYFEGQIDDAGVVSDELVVKGVSVPPFHVSCRSRVKGVFSE